MWKWIKKWFKKTEERELQVINAENIEQIIVNWATQQGVNVNIENGECALIDFQGNYAVTGSNPGSSEADYFGQLSLQPHGQLVKATWQIGYNNQEQKGIGFIHKNLLALDFYYTERGTRFYGQVIYAKENDELRGFWVEKGVESVGTENASWLNGLV